MCPPGITQKHKAAELQDPSHLLTINILRRGPRPFQRTPASSMQGTELCSGLRIPGTGQALIWGPQRLALRRCRGSPACWHDSFVILWIVLPRWRTWKSASHSASANWRQKKGSAALITVPHFELGEEPQEKNKTAAQKQTADFKKRHGTVADCNTICNSKIPQSSYYLPPEFNFCSLPPISRMLVQYAIIFSSTQSKWYGWDLPKIPFWLSKSEWTL